MDFFDMAKGPSLGFDFARANSTFDTQVIAYTLETKGLVQVYGSRVMWVGGGGGGGVTEGTVTGFI